MVCKWGYFWSIFKMCLLLYFEDINIIIFLGFGSNKMLYIYLFIYQNILATYFTKIWRSLKLFAFQTNRPPKKTLKVEN